ncbi:MAG: tol-pal system protein YbgF [Allorhizobium sp.]
MKKLVMAGMLGLASLTGLQETVNSAPLFGHAAITHPRPTTNPDVHFVQAGDPAMKVLELQEEIRTLTGRIEEMSFQLLQMQEQMRKAQEDNEFRFQELEKGGTRKSGALDNPVDSGAPQDSVAGIITAPDNSAAPAETQLGSIELDKSGMPVTATINGSTSNSSALPGVTSAPAGTTASLNSEADVYQVAYGHVLSGDYGIAETEFNDFISRYPKSKKAADAHFWLGEAQYSQAKFNDAAKTFLDAHKAFASSPKAPEMLLKLGMSLAALDNKDTACATLREVPKRYPSASRAVLGKVTSEQKRLSC